MLFDGFSNVFSAPLSYDDVSLAVSLGIERTVSCVTIRWPSSAAGFTLQSTSDLGTGNWQTVATPPTQNGQNFEVAMPAIGTTFYRLKK